MEFSFSFYKPEYISAQLAFMKSTRYEAAVVLFLIAIPSWSFHVSTELFPCTYSICLQ
jgi:hypothetical protein